MHSQQKERGWKLSGSWETKVTLQTDNFEMGINSINKHELIISQTFNTDAKENQKRNGQKGILHLQKKWTQTWKFLWNSRGTHQASMSTQHQRRAMRNVVRMTTMRTVSRASPTFKVRNNLKCRNCSLKMQVWIWIHICMKFHRWPWNTSRQHCKQSRSNRHVQKIMSHWCNP